MKSINALGATLLTSVAAMLISGCGISTTDTNSGAITPAAMLGGSIFGGRQAISGSAVNMYAAGSTGYGSAATSILNNGVTVTSDANGSFILTGKYTCPSSSSLIYVTATGGNAGSGTNTAVGLMAALGTCGSLSSSTSIVINEVSTVSAVWPLAPFSSGPTAIGSSATNNIGIVNAFNDVPLLSTLSSGTSPGVTPAGSSIPTATINTIANILASCVNSNGSSTSCSTLFTAATVGGVTPADTLTAAINIAQHPGSNVATLYGLSTAAAPFQPTLSTAPTDMTLSANFKVGTNPVLSVAHDASGNAWVVDGATVSRLNPQGVQSNITTASSGLPYVAVAVDQSGNAWAAGKTNNTLLKVSAAGASTSYTGGGLSTPTAIAIDGQGQIWLTNATTVSAFAQTGTPISSTGYSVGSSTPNDIAFNAH